MKEGIEIINKDGLSMEYILGEIEDIEKAKNRKVIKAEFEDRGDGTSLQRFWFAPVGMERLRRVTGYLVGTVDKMNNAKQAEVRDRVKHTTSCECTEGR